MIHVWLAPVPGGPLVVDRDPMLRWSKQRNSSTPSPQNPTA